MDSNRSTPGGGSYQRWLGAAGLAVVPFMTVILVLTSQFNGLESQAALEQASVARRLAAGQGFTTSVILPRTLAYNPSLTAHPELRQGPVSVLAGTMLIKALGEREGRTLAFSSMLAWLLAVWLAFAAARTLFGPRAGVLAALLMTFSPAALSLAISGDGRVWLMPLLLLLWLFLATPAGAGGAATRPVVCGVLVGLAALTAYQLTLPLLLVVFPALAAASPDATPPAPARGRAVLLAAVALFVVVAPWLVRNQRVAGTPLPGPGTYSIMSYTQDSPGRSVERRLVQLGASPLRFVWDHKRQLLQKVLTGVYNLRSMAAQTIDGPLWGLFLAALLMPVAGATAAARRALPWALLWHAALLSFGSQEYRLLGVWAPVLAVFGAGFLAQRLDDGFADPARFAFTTWSPEGRRRLATSAILLILLLPGLGPQMFSGARNRGDGPSGPNWKVLRQTINEGQVIMCDDPWSVAWEVDRPCVWLAHSPDDLAALQKAQPVRAIYFSYHAAPASGSFSPAERGKWWSWAQVMPQGFLEFKPLDTRVEGERVLLRDEPAKAGSNPEGVGGKPAQ